MKRQNRGLRALRLTPRQWLEALAYREGIDLASQPLPDALNEMLTGLEQRGEAPSSEQAYCASLLLRTAAQRLRDIASVEKFLAREQAAWQAQRLSERWLGDAGRTFQRNPHFTEVSEPDGPAEPQELSYWIALALGGPAIERRKGQGRFTLLDLQQQLQHLWNYGVFRARLRIDPGVDPCLVSSLLEAHDPEHYWRLPARFHLDRPFGKKLPPLSPPSRRLAC